MLSVADLGPPPACPAPYNAARDVLQAGRATPDKPALVVVGGETYSFARLEAAVRGIAAGFLAKGLVPGDRLLMRLGNDPAFPLVYLAALAVDIIPVPTAAGLTPPEITAVSNIVAPRAMVASPGIACPAGVPRLLDIQVLHWQSMAPADYAMGDPDRPGYIIFTSGTSGQPRAVVHAHRAIHARRMMWSGWYGLTPDDRMLHAGAFNWTYTLGTGLLDPWAAGATAVIPAHGTPSAGLPAVLADRKATIFAAAPGVYRQMLKPGTPLALPHLRHGLSAGEALSPGLRARWEQLSGTPVFEAFGQSECSTFISGAPGQTLPDGATGYAQPGRHIAVLGPDGTPTPRGTPGTLAVHRSDPGLMLGYLDAAEDTADRMCGPWYLTGDTVLMNSDGAITYLGRDDDMMNAGGFRVSPVEVETALCAHPQITEAAAIAIPVKADAYVIGAYYVSTDPLDETALTAFLSQRLAPYKTPRLLHRVATLPRGANGKLQRARLRLRHEANHGET